MRYKQSSEIKMYIGFKFYFYSLQKFQWRVFCSETLTLSDFSVLCLRKWNFKVAKPITNVTIKFYLEFELFPVMLQNECKNMIKNFLFPRF